MKSLLTSKVLLVAIALVVVAGGYSVASPYLVMAEIRMAIQEGKPDVLRKYVDFPAVRENLKAEINAKTMGDAVRKKDKNPYGAFGAALAAAIIGPIIDMYLTPEALIELGRGQNPGDRGKKNSSVTEVAADMSQYKGTYEAWDRFVLTVPSKDGKDSAGFVFTREHLTGWRITSLRMPADWYSK